MQNTCYRITLFSVIIFLSFCLFCTCCNGLVIGYHGRSILNWHLFVILDRKQDFLPDTEVKIIPFNNIEQAISALESGYINILDSAMSEDILVSQKKSDAIVATAGLINHIPYFLATLETQEFPGKYIGVQSYKSPMAFLLKKKLADHDLAYGKDYRFFEIPFQQAYQAFEYGKLNAVLLTGPFDPAVGLNRFLSLRDAYDPYLFSAVAMNRQWAASNQDDAFRIIMAVIKSVNWLEDQQNREEAVAILQKYIKVSQKSSRIMYDEFFGQGSPYIKDAELSWDGFQNVSNLFNASGFQVGLIYSNFSELFYQQTALIKIKSETLSTLEHKIQKFHVTPPDNRNENQLAEWENEKERIQQTLESSIPGGVYSLRVKHSGQYLDVKARSSEDGTNIQQSPYNGGDNQRFTIVPKGDDYYLIVAKHSGQCVDVKENSFDDGANVQQSSYNGGNNQLFTFVPVQDGYFKIAARHSRLCLDVKGESIENGANVQQSIYHGGDNQLWQLEK